MFLLFLKCFGEFGIFRTTGMHAIYASMLVVLMHKYMYNENLRLVTTKDCGMMLFQIACKDLSSLVVKWLRRLLLKAESTGSNPAQAAHIILADIAEKRRVIPARHVWLDISTWCVQNKSSQTYQIESSPNVGS